MTAKRLKLLLGTGALTLGVALPASAASAATIYAGPLPVSYLNPNVAIDPGEELTFSNIDLTAPHDVTSLDVGSDARPLFRSETISAPGQVPVVGADKLGGGSYDYICSIHPNMTGTLTVRGDGGGGGGDNEGPSLKVKPTERKAKAALKDGKLGFEVTVNEQATLKLTVTEGKTKVANGSAKLRRGTSAVGVRFTRAGKKLLKRADGTVTLSVKAKATDAAGNSTTEKSKAKLR